MVEKVFKFQPIKSLKFLKELGRGGTGKTVLALDEYTNLKFAIKEYSPIEANDRKECYERFVEEAKLLMMCNHKNIVRIFNYYFYPDKFKGYLQMEYFEGYSIDKYKVTESNKSWNSIFNELIETFAYLESKRILHRDIRASNILINDLGEIKVIDFGFGKNYEIKTDNSVMLNWDATTAPELYDNTYDWKTEMYYLGKLLLLLINDDSFEYYDIVRKMTSKNPDNRYDSFQEILICISSSGLNVEEFTENDINIYQLFVHAMCQKINFHYNQISLVKNADIVIEKLNDLLKRQSLENNIQNNSLLINCFIENGYSYSNSATIPVDVVRNFLIMFTEKSVKQKQIILDNIGVRIGKIRIDDFYDIQF